MSKYFAIKSPLTGTTSYINMDHIAQIMPAEKRLVMKDGRLVGISEGDLANLIVILDRQGKIENDN